MKWVFAALVGAAVLAAAPARAQSSVCTELERVVREAREAVRAAETQGREARAVEQRTERVIRRAREGVPGTHRFNNLSISFIGEYSNGMANGLGQSLFVSGEHVADYYVGEFRDGGWNGLGVYHGRLDGGAEYTYAGEWVNGFRHGYGVLDSGGLLDRYAGQFRDGQRRGLGMSGSLTGNYYLGQTASDQAHGYGIASSEGARFGGRFIMGELVESCATLPAVR